MIIKHFTIVLIMLVPFFQSNAQYRYEFGGMGGGTFYLGDANPSNLFSDIGGMYGALARYNISYRAAIKANVYKGSITGNVSGGDPDFPGVTDDISFATDYYDVGVNCEYNFFAYTSENVTGASIITPYIFSGLGVTYTNQLIFNIPLGVGLKYMFTKRMNIGAELGVRKLFADNLENIGGLDNPDEIEGSIFINNDYVFGFGFFITANISYRKWCCNNPE